MEKKRIKKKYNRYIFVEHFMYLYSLTIFVFEVIIIKKKNNVDIIEIVGADLLEFSCATFSLATVSSENI